MWWNLYGLCWTVDVFPQYFKYILLMVDKDEYRTDDDLFQVHMLIMDIEVIVLVGFVGVINISEHELWLSNTELLC